MQRDPNGTPRAASCRGGNRVKGNRRRRLESRSKTRYPVDCWQLQSTACQPVVSTFQPYFPLMSASGRVSRDPGSLSWPLWFTIILVEARPSRWGWHHVCTSCLLCPLPSTKIHTHAPTLNTKGLATLILAIGCGKRGLLASGP